MAEEADRDSWRRQLDELGAIAAMYPDEVLAETPAVGLLRAKAVGAEWEGPAAAPDATEGAAASDALVLRATVVAADGSDVLVQLSMGPRYPDREPLGVRVATGARLSKAGAAALQASLESFLPRDAEAVADAVAYVADNADGFFDRGASGAAVSGGGDKPEGAGGVQATFLLFNHLLHGKAHKKEAAMVSAAASMGLRGMVVYGTPGIIVLADGSGGDDTSAYLAECKRIGKKGALTASYPCVAPGTASGGAGSGAGRSKKAKSKKKASSDGSGGEPGAAVLARWLTGDVARGSLAAAELVDVRTVLEALGRGDDYRSVIGVA